MVNRIRRADNGRHTPPANGRRNLRLVLPLAVLVAFVVSVALIVPASTLEKDTALAQGGIDLPAAEEMTDAQAAENGSAEEEKAAAKAETADGAVAPADADAGAQAAEDQKAQPAEEQAQPAEDTEDAQVSTAEAEAAAGTEGPNGLTFEEKGFTISADCSRADLPADTELTATEITENDKDYQAWHDEALAALQQESGGDEIEDLAFARFFDISLISEGEEVEPDNDVDVTIRYDKAIRLDDADQVRVIHFTADGSGTLQGEILEDERISLDLENTKSSGAADMNGTSFTADSFSMYAVVEAQTFEKTIITADGRTCTVTVTAGPDAKIPQDAELAVTEIAEDDPSWKEYAEGTAEALNTKAGRFTYTKFLDITILHEGQEIQPSAKVDVEIRMDDRSQGNDLQVVHFGEEKEVIEADTEGDTVSFKAASFSVYTVVGSGDTSDLDGKTYALINNYTHIAMQDQQLNATNLSGVSITSETRNDKLYYRSNEDVTFWTFTAAGDGKYYISNADGKYLNITGERRTGTVTVTDEPQALNVTAGTGNRAGRIRITNDGQAAINNYNGSLAGGFGVYDDNGNNEWLTLVDMVALNPEYSAEKISVQDVKDAQRVIIYRSVYNEQTEKYEDYVIDGNGQMVRAYDKGDQVVGRSAVSPVWVVTFGTNDQGEYTGYYIIQNEETGLCLSPQADGTLVAEYESSTTSGVTLNGRRDGGYTSTIEKWDNSAWGWYGYQTKREEDGSVTLSSAGRGSSQEFSFASLITDQTAELHEVPTVDSASAGIRISMFDYPNRNTISNVTGSNNYSAGVLPPQHASMTLTNGYPTFGNGTRSGSTLFSKDSSYYQGEGNHIFLESVYNSTGYYEYNAFNNFAHYNKDDGTFTVYQEIGTPSNDNAIWYKRGNFFPYNSLDVTRKATNTNDYDGSGTQLDIEDPLDHGTLYLINNPEFYYGMSVEATFMQPKGGEQEGNPVVYEFNGDDDLWIYIDGVLVLDIGGVHDAWPGLINFATGEIIGRGAGGAKTIKDCFKNAGVFPDGTAWDDNRVNEYFRGNTFIDYGSHTFNMFYLEHGAGASNLEMRFNLPIIEKGKFTVEKELAGTDQQRYSNVYFAYQAFRKEGETDIPLTEAVYEGTSDPVTFYPSVTINGKTYTNVFYLKPGEAAVFPEMADEIQYYVQELGVGSDYYDEVVVNDVSIDGVDVTPTDGVYPTSVAAVGNRARVSYTNRCADKNLNDLRITKALSEGSVDDGSTFEFRVLLENSDGALAPYSTGEYYIQDENGDYYHYVGGRLVSNGKTPIVASVTGNNGTVAGIPAGYTVVIANLLADTDFYVEEIRNPAGWKLEKKEVAENSCDASDLTGTGWSGNTVTADGKIRLGTDAQLTFTNKAAQKLVVKKEWNAGQFVTAHGDIKVALFKQKQDGSLELVEGSVKTISAPAATAEYRAAKIADYVVREVTVSGSTVTPIEEDGTIAVSGETTAIGSDCTDTYVASYEQGTAQTVDDPEEDAELVREDTITNTMRTLTVNKKDPDGAQLAGAKFRLLKEDRKTAITGYEEITSTDAAAGNLLQDICLANGTYYLEETKAPAGYDTLEHMLKITVSESGITMATDIAQMPTVYTDETPQDDMDFTFSVVNNPGVELPASGGPGVIWMYLLGSVLLIGAGVCLIARRRIRV